MGVINSSSNPIYAIINDFYTKHKDDKFKFQKFPKFLSDRNYSLEDFYLQLMDELEANLENINNLIKAENFFFGTITITGFAGGR